MADLTPEAIAELRRLLTERQKIGDWFTDLRPYDFGEWGKASAALLAAAGNALPALLDAAERCAAAEALADKLASGVKMACAAPVCDLCGWSGDWVPTLKEASDVVKAHMHHCDEVQKLVDAKAEAQAKAAGELLRICNAMLDDEDYCYPETLPAAVEAAERAGVKP